MDGALREQAPPPPAEVSQAEAQAAAAKSRLQDEAAAGVAAFRERLAAWKLQSSSHKVTSFEEQIAAVVEAADDCHVRWKEPEGRFILALLGSLRMLTEVVSHAEGSFSATAAHAQGIAEAELKKVRELVVAIDGAKMQARATVEAGKADQEMALRKMVADTLPRFLEGIRTAAVIRERSWNRQRAGIGFGLAGFAFLGVFLAGFGLCLWIQWAQTDLGARCMHMMFRSGGQTFCTVDGASPPQKGTTEEKGR